MTENDAKIEQKNEAQPDEGYAKEHKRNLYGETKRSSEYSTDDFKLELMNLPGNPKFHSIKTFLERQFKLTPHKIRVGHKRAYCTFKSEQERDEALLKLNNQEWKGKRLIVQVAGRRDDLLAKKRKLVQDGVSEGDVAPKEEEIAEDTITDDDINNQVCPLWSKDYDDQIKFKDDLIRSVLSMSRQLQKMCPNIRDDAPQLYEWLKANEKICCRFDGVERSPVLTGYRNKCEFNISHDGSVGFKMGRYKNGSDRVRRPPDNCPILTKKMFEIIDTFQDYLKNISKLKPYDLVSHEGHFRQITVRCNSSDEYLTIIDIHPQNLSEEELNEEVELIASNLKLIDKVVSIYVNISTKCQLNSNNQSLRLIHGQESLYENLVVDLEKPLKFRIGPVSFFQVNSRAAELLYRSIIEVANLTSKTMVLDVGCGTGTIGLSLASHVNHVIGIEIVAAAIEDAKMNAQANGITNVTYFAGKAEDLIGESIAILKNKLEYQKIEDGEIVAIVDPPRVGFNSSFIKTIRASNIKKIVYIACDPKANQNLLSLCRPKSKAYQGDPFVPTRAKAFDMFPHTKCCELLLVYERLSMLKKDTQSKI